MICVGSKWVFKTTIAFIQNSAHIHTTQLVSKLTRIATSVYKKMAEYLNPKFLIQVLIVTVNETISIANLENVWCRNEWEAHREIASRIEDANPDELGNARLDRADNKWDIPFRGDPTTRLHLILEPVPRKLPYAGFTTRRETLWELCPKSTPSSPEC